MGDNIIKRSVGGRAVTRKLDSNKLLITADTREVKSGIPAQLAALPEVKSVVKVLTCGDYQCGNQVISRKTVSDFLNSVDNGHLEVEMHKCIKENGKKEVEHWLLLEDDGWGEPSWADIFAAGGKAGNFSCGRFNGIVTALQRRGIGLLFSPGKQYTPGVIVQQCKREPGAEGRFMNRYIRPEHRLNVPEQVAALLDLWPRLPEGVAGELIKKFKTAWAVLNLPEAVLLKTKGVGPGLLKNLKERIGKK